MVDANKLFQLRCQRCRHSEFSSGLKADLGHLFELKACEKCGGKRRFRCPKCSGLYVMKRLAGNNAVTPEAPPEAN